MVIENIYCDKCNGLMKRLQLKNTFFCPKCNLYKRFESEDKKVEEKSTKSEIPLSEDIIEKIDRLIGIFHDNGIEYFNYLTPIENLDSIILNGIVSRNVLLNSNADFRDISKKMIQDFRQRSFNVFFDEAIHNYVPLYISSHTRMIRPIAVPFKHHYAVLKLDPFLFYGLREDRIKKIKISNSSINQRYRHSEFRIINIFDNIDQIEDFLDWDLFNTNIHYSDSWKGQKKSAEILIPVYVPPDYISKICPKCSEKVLKRHISKIRILKLSDFNHNEFNFVDEEPTEFSISLDFSLDDLEEEDEIDYELDNDEDTLNDDEWSKFEGIL